MRRAQAIFVVIAILALPLAPLAWGMACESESVPMMCCIMHTSHSASGQLMRCHCTGKSQQPPPDTGMIPPIPPGIAAARIEIAAPQDAREKFFAFSKSETSGYLSAPFEPPRA
jgi:hypothetical protein